MERNKLIQRVLRGQSLYWGKIDGQIGPKSKKAIAAFQRINPPLEITGIADKETLSQIFPKPIAGRDISAPNGRNDFPSYKGMRDFYGPVGRSQTRVKLPYPMRIAWDLNKTIRSFSCHEKVAENIQEIFEDTLSVYKYNDICHLGLDLFGGCLNVRKMRGGTKYSTHAWGAAIDIDPARNRLRWDHKKAELAKPDYDDFWKIVERCGATSLGKERDYDWMHFQFANV